MKQLKIFFLIFSFTIISCQEKKSKEGNLKNDIYNEIIGHTFFKIEETKNGKVLYKPCDANIQKYKVYKDSIFHNWGQEYYTYNIESIKKIKTQITYKTTYKYNGEIPDTKDSLMIFERIGKDKAYWKINGELFIDSLYISSVSHVNQPCSECYDDCEDIISNNGNSNFEKWYGRYQVLLNEDKDWEEQVSITIDVKHDSLIYEASGYQIFEKYLLKNDEKIGNDVLKLSFDKLLDGSKSFLLEKTKDFGTITFNGKKYTWESPYVNESFMEGKKKTYVLKKEQ
ncbi:MAG: hypothetical protein E2590_07335 [Chryseobacterium sp.]|nr:hypothetical protein [Chryseobacterium sp.]